MKAIELIILAILTIGLQPSCSAQSEKENKKTTVAKVEKIEVFYFHYTRRCATCNAVGSVSKEAVNELYGDKVSFADYNLDEEAGKKIGKKLKVSGQTLLIVAGDTQINITNEGFMNARKNPDKLKAIIKEKIDPLL